MSDGGYPWKHYDDVRIVTQTIADMAVLARNEDCSLRIESDTYWIRVSWFKAPFNSTRYQNMPYMLLHDLLEEKNRDYNKFARWLQWLKSGDE